MLFRKITLYSFSALGFFTLLWLCQIGLVKESDILTYRKMKNRHEVASSPQVFATSTHQTRQGVRKDIWFSQEDKSRLHTRIESASSLLTIQPKEHNYEVIEELQKIHCWMQDRVYVGEGGKPMQQMRYIEADSGTYLYTTQQFLAQTVVLSLFRLPGHSLLINQDQSAAFIRGIAQDVSFSVSGKSPQFQAKNFKAQFSKTPGGNL